MNWTIRNRLLAGCGALVIVLAAACLLGWQQAANSEKRIASIIKDNQSDLEQLDQVQESEHGSIAARGEEVEFFLTREAARAEAVHQHVGEIKKHLGSVANATDDATQKQAISRALDLAGRGFSTDQAASDAVAYRVPVTPSVDGNTVELSTEQTLFAENAVQYRATLAFLEGRISTIRRALKGE